MAARAYRPPGPARVIVNPSLRHADPGAGRGDRRWCSRWARSSPAAGRTPATRTCPAPASTRQTVSQLHADAVMLLVGLTVATLLWLRGSKAPPAATRAAAVLLAVELAQGADRVRAVLHRPAGARWSAVHLLGACLVWIAALRLLLATSTRQPAPATGHRGHRGVRGGLRPRCETIGACPTPTRFPPSRSPPRLPRRRRSSATASTSSPRPSARARPRDLFWPWFARQRLRPRARATAPSCSASASRSGRRVDRRRGRRSSCRSCSAAHRAGRQARLRADHGAAAGPRSGCSGNRLPSALSWLLTVGWETVLVILATLATATVFDQLGWGGGTGTKVVALIVVAGAHDRRRRARLRR